MRIREEWNLGAVLFRVSFQVFTRQLWYSGGGLTPGAHQYSLRIFRDLVMVLASSGGLKLPLSLGNRLRGSTYTWRIKERVSTLVPKELLALQKDFFSSQNASHCLHWDYPGFTWTFLHQSFVGDHGRDISDLQMHKKDDSFQIHSRNSPHP